MAHAAIEQMMAKLARIREMYGDAAYERAAKDAAKMLIQTNPQIADLAKEALKGVVDIKAVEEEITRENTDPNARIPNLPGLNAESLMIHALRAQMPGLQTQAQFDIFMATFNSLRVYMNATFLGDKEQATTAREALLQGLDLAVEATDLSSKLGHVPEAATSKAAEAYKNPPAEFTEGEQNRALLEELSRIETPEALSQWYSANRDRIDRVKTTEYRNAIFDMIRTKRVSFTRS